MGDPEEKCGGIFLVQLSNCWHGFFCRLASRVRSIVGITAVVLQQFYRFLRSYEEASFGRVLSLRYSVVPIRFWCRMVDAADASRLMADMGGVQGAQLNPRSEEFIHIKHMLQVSLLEIGWYRVASPIPSWLRVYVNNPSFF